MREDSLDFDKLGIHLDKTDIRILKLLANDCRNCERSALITYGSKRKSYENA